MGARKLRAVTDQDGQAKAPVALPSSIDPTELAYLQTLVGEQQAAQSATNKYVNYLAQKYQCGPKDQLALDGSITRVEADKD